MAIQKTTFLYEVLVRLGPEGFHGAHVIEVERVADGDEIIAEKFLPARAVTSAEVGAIIGSEQAALIEAIDTARATAAEMHQALKVAADEREALEKAAKELGRERDEAIAAAEHARAELARVYENSEAAGEEPAPAPKRKRS